jgi:hypothetical protein
MNMAEQVLLAKEPSCLQGLIFGNLPAVRQAQVTESPVSQELRVQTD